MRLEVQRRCLGHHSRMPLFHRQSSDPPFHVSKLHSLDVAGGSGSRLIVVPTRTRSTRKLGRPGGSVQGTGSDAGTRGPEWRRAEDQVDYFWSVEVQLTMTVSGVAVAVFCGLLTRNRCPSLVTAYTWMTLTTPVGKSVFGTPAKAS